MNGFDTRSSVVRRNCFYDGFIIRFKIVDSVLGDGWNQIQPSFIL